MRAALVLALFALLLVPAGAAAQGELPVDPTVIVPGAPGGDEPTADEEPSQPDAAPACDPALEACGQPCAPDVDESCAPECDAPACEAAAEGAGDGAEERPQGLEGPRARVRPAATTSGNSTPVFRSASAVTGAQDEGSLPRTGAEAWQLALAGVLLLTAGLRLRSRTEGPA